MKQFYSRFYTARYGNLYCTILYAYALACEQSSILISKGDLSIMLGLLMSMFVCVLVYTVFLVLVRKYLPSETPIFLTLFHEIFPVYAGCMAFLYYQDTIYETNLAIHGVIMPLVYVAFYGIYVLQEKFDKTGETS